MANVIVTGTSSFVGCHLARAFAAAGHVVTATHSRPRAAYDGIRADRLDFAAGRAALAQLDITDAGAVAALAAQVRPGIWVHHAGYATDYASPGYDMVKAAAVNLAPLDAIYEAMAGTGGGVLITGSNAEYADSPDKVTEDARGEPATPYGRAKLAETMRARDLSERLNVPTRVARLFIPFGRLDNPVKLLAKTEAALRARKPIALSPGTQRRDFIAIGDVCSLWLRLADDLRRGGFDIFNACSGEATELRALLCAMADAMGADRALLDFGAHPMRPGEPEVSVGDNGKARRLLGWSPRPLDQAVREDLLEEPARPKVSVLMSVLNGEAYLAEAIDSILAQTLRDFELVIVDNASTDRTAAIIAGYDDPRIVAVRNSETVNLSQSLNIGLKRARGEYVARLDADDIALPDRLAKQAAHLDSHPEVALVASTCTEFGMGTPFPGRPGATPPAEHDALMVALARDSILSHSTIMFRRLTVVDLGGYDEAFSYCMDYVLYFRVAAQRRLAAIPQPLTAIRLHDSQITHRPEWAARRHLEADTAFRQILDGGMPLAPAVRRCLRRYRVLTDLRLAKLYIRTGKPFEGLRWLLAAFIAGPAACAGLAGTGLQKSLLRR